MLAALGGCAQLAGIDDTSGTPDAAVPTGSSIDFERVSIGATLETNPQDLTGQTAAYLQYGDAGLTEVAATLGGPGNNTWSSDLTDPTPVRVSLPTVVVPVIFDLPNTTVHAQTAAFEHPDPQAPPTGATIAIDATVDAIPAPTDTFTLRVVGPWLAKPVATAGKDLRLVEPATPYTDLTPGTAAPIAAFTAADVLLVERHDGAGTLTGFVEQAPADQTATTTITGQVTSVAPDQTLDATFDAPGVTARLGTVQPVGGAAAHRYTVFAAPGADFGEPTGIKLVSAAIPATQPPGPLTGVMFANPFLALHGWQSVVQYAASTSRTYENAALGVTFRFGSGLTSIEKFGAGQSLSQDAALPNLISIDGAQMSIDGGTVATPTAPVVVTCATDKTLETALYTATLVELSASTDTVPAAVTTTIATVVSTTPTLRFPPALFVAGKYYVVQVNVTVGLYSSLATGDLRMRSLPVSYASHVSGAFQVVAP